MFEIKDAVLIKYTGSCETAEIPDSVRSIAPRAFEYCKSVKRVIFPPSLTEIGEEAFSECSSLEKAVLPDSLKAIGERAFSRCKKLCDINLPGALSQIGEFAFEWTALESVRLPAALKTLEKGVFERSKIKSINLSDITQIGERAFAFCAFLEEITVPDCVKSIGAQALRACARLKRASLGAGLTFVPEGCFEECDSLESVTLGAVVIGDRAFSACKSLRELCLPEGLKKIGASSFRRCESLACLRIPAGTEYIGENAFSGCAKTHFTFAGALGHVGALAFPDSELTAPESVRSCLSSSFVNRKSLDTLPEICVGEKTLYFKPSLNAPVRYPGEETESGRAHIVQLRGFNLRLFIGKDFFSKGEHLIDGGELRFDVYESYFIRADFDEKYKAAAMLLAQMGDMSKETADLYKSALGGFEERAAQFAVQKSLPLTLAYILSVFPFSETQLRRLHKHARAARNEELLNILALATAAESSDIFSFDSENADFWQTRESENGLILTRYTGGEYAVSLPRELCGRTVFCAGENVFGDESPSDVAVPEGLYYPGGGLSDCVVRFESYNASVYVPVGSISVPSAVIGGRKYFDFGAFDDALENAGDEEILRAAAYRLLYPVDLKEKSLKFYLRLINENKSLLNSRLTAAEIKLLSQALKDGVKPYFSEEFLRTLPDKGGRYEDGEAILTFDENGTLLSAKSKTGKALVIPEFIRKIAGGALSGVSVETLVLPFAVSATQAGSFSGLKARTLVLSERTYIAPELFILCEGLERFIFITAEAQRLVLPVLSTGDFKSDMRRNYIFISRLGVCDGTSVDLRSYDALPLPRGEAVKRACARLGSYFPPNAPFEEDVTLAAFVKMAEDGDSESFSRAVGNGFWLEKYTPSVLAVTDNEKIIGRIS